MAKIGGNYAVRVATSDSLVQLASLRGGVLRMSARELREELEAANREMDILIQILIVRKEAINIKKEGDELEC